MKKSLTPNNYGKFILSENCHKVDVNSLIARYRNEFKKFVLQSELEINSLKVEIITSKTNYGGDRFWFKCPHCRRRIGVIYQNPLDASVGCRTCIGVKYASSAKKGMLEAEFYLSGKGGHHDSG